MPAKFLESFKKKIQWETQDFVKPFTVNKYILNIYNKYNNINHIYITHLDVITESKI